MTTMSAHQISGFLISDLQANDYGFSNLAFRSDIEKLHALTGNMDLVVTYGQAIAGKAGSDKDLQEATKRALHLELLRYREDV